MESSSKFERLRDIAIETLRYFSSELFYLIQFLREQILDFCDNAKRRKIDRFSVFTKEKKGKKSVSFKRLCTQRFFSVKLPRI